MKKAVKFISFFKYPYYDKLCNFDYVTNLKAYSYFST